MNSLIKTPFPIGKIHFVGIGGIGMSGIAEIFHNLGYNVQGSDVSKGSNIERLTKIGIKVYIGHDAENIAGADVVVISSAIKNDNKELIEARRLMLPIVKRAEMLAELMRLKWSIAIAGTHGKTTTTSLVSHILHKAGVDPTVVIGGILNSWGTNSRVGSGSWLVTEADESDGSFLKLPATVAIVTNIDPEHLDYYQDFDEIKRAFIKFVSNIPFYGYAVLCIDHPEVQAMLPQVQDRRIITYGFSPQADVRADNINITTWGSSFDVIIQRKTQGDPLIIKGLEINIPGEHNIKNALAAIAVADRMGVSEDLLRESLLSFEGVDRRFSRRGIVNGITIVDDYAHHPVEVSAVLAAARATCKNKVIAVFQPHRYTRLRDNFSAFCRSFNQADHVIISEIYSAGEAKMDEFTGRKLVDGIIAHGHRNVQFLENNTELANMISEIANDGDFVIVMGAGSSTIWARELPKQLDEIKNGIYEKKVV